MTLSQHQEQRIRRLAFRLSEYNPSDDDAFYDAAIAHITEFVRELNETWEAYSEASQTTNAAHGDGVETPSTHGGRAGIILAQESTNGNHQKLVD